jgi:hypothetical protein
MRRLRHYTFNMKKKKKPSFSAPSLALSVSRIREDIGIAILAVGMVLLITLGGLSELRTLSENQRQKEYYYLYAANIIKHNIECSDSIISQAKEGLAMLASYQKIFPSGQGETPFMDSQDIPDKVINSCFYFELISGMIKDRDFISLTLMNKLEHFYDSMVGYQASLLKIEDALSGINSQLSSRKGPEFHSLKAAYETLLGNIMEVKQKESIVISDLGRLGISMKGGISAASSAFLSFVRIMLALVFIALVFVLAGVFVIFFKDILNPKINRPGVL